MSLASLLRQRASDEPPIIRPGPIPSNAGIERYRPFNPVEQAVAPQQLARPVPGAEHRITIASGGLQTSAVADCNFTATTADRALPLQLLSNQIYSGPANAKGFGNRFLRHPNYVRPDGVAGPQEPPAKARVGAMNRVAKGGALRL